MEILEHGGAAVLKPREFQYKSIRFGIAPFTASVVYRLTWNDAVKILDAFQLKMDREGYLERWGRIFVTRVGHSQTVGSALISQDSNAGTEGGIDTS